MPVLNDPRWGAGQRALHAIAPEMLAKIRAGSPLTDAKYAAELGYSRLSVRQIRLGARHPLRLAHGPGSDTPPSRPETDLAAESHIE